MYIVYKSLIEGILELNNLSPIDYIETTEIGEYHNLYNEALHLSSQGLGELINHKSDKWFSYNGITVYNSLEEE